MLRQKPVDELYVLDAQLIRNDLAVERLRLELGVVQGLVDVKEHEHKRFE